MNLDESTTTTTTPPPPPPTSSSKRNGDSTSDDDEIMVWEPNANSPTCGKAHCRLGCICSPDEFSSQPSQQQQQTSSSPVSNKSTASSSSSATSMQSQHCGRYECMFECLCSRRLRSSTRSNRSTVANDIVLPPASEANATSSATTTYSIGTRRREASVSSTNSIFSNRYYIENKFEKISYNSYYTRIINKKNSWVNKNSDNSFRYDSQTHKPWFYYFLILKIYYLLFIHIY